MSKKNKSVDKPILPGDRRKTRWQYLLAQPDFERELIMFIVQGGTLRSFSQRFDVPYPWLYEHITQDPALNQKYIQACDHRLEYMKQFVFDQFQLLAASDITTLFNDDGSLKPPKDWPEAARQFVASIEVDELFEGAGRERQQVGFTKKVKLWDKSRALEQVAKHIGVDKSEEPGKLSWEAIILMAMKKEGERAVNQVVEPKAESRPLTQAVPTGETNETD